MRNVREQSEKILSLKGLLSQDVIAILNSVEEPGLLADLVASNLRLKIDEFQSLLELVDPLERLQKVYEHLGKELEVSTVQARIQSEAKEEMSKSQREYFLREQMQAIRRELGEYDERQQEVTEYRDKIKKLHLTQRNRGRGPEATGPAGADAFRIGRNFHRPDLPGLDRQPALG